ncbi:molybdenum cofactor guanylyltransferase [Winogradskyella sp. Asnod2-B02-A]|uniref:molybdenum cofactor guanylyltransferase n=1 Tax=Winogradskyella sp. Asnod2-B02-A TaxID=3160583 RepID=UPI003864E54C
MRDKKNITGIILAGGASSRMGTDKGFLKLNNKLFIQHIIDAVKPLVSRIIIVSNLKKYDAFGIERITDDIENAGPLAGIYSGLKASKTEYNLVLSCDVPLIKKRILQQLIDASEDTIDIVQIESQGQHMPLIAVYKKSCASMFHKLLLNDERRLHKAVSACNTKSIILNTEDDIYTTNVNTPEQFKNLTQCL